MRSLGTHPSLRAARDRIARIIAPSGEQGRCFSYRAALRRQLARPRRERVLDLAGAGYEAEQQALLESARKLEAVQGLEVVESGLPCQGYGFCQHYALSRVLGVEGQTPPVFIGRTGPLQFQRLLARVFRAVD